MNVASPASTRTPFPGSASEVFRAFLRLGLTSFGGPVAHLGYFRDAFVRRRQWLSEAQYAETVALCQFLPGPASSQVGFAIGLTRAGLPGGLAAFAGFTLPSALLMAAIAIGFGSLGGGAVEGVLHGLKLVAVAVVAQAVWGMGRSLLTEPGRIGIAVLAFVLFLVPGGATGQLVGIASGALLGLALLAPASLAAAADDAMPAPAPGAIRRGLALVVLAAALLFLLPLLAASGAGGRWLPLFEAFYRAGALVFGGGHVVLPLLQESVVAQGLVTQETFLAGYGAAQAMPGPLFTFAAFLGAAALPGDSAILGAAVALAGIFLPGLLLVAGCMPLWQKLRGGVQARAAMAGVNAAVVGILAGALYDPVATSAIAGIRDAVVAALALAALLSGRMPPIAVVAACAAAGWALRA